MKEIIEAQGGDHKITSDDIEVGRHKIEVKAEKEGYIVGIDNKAVVSLARAAGAPKDKGAGLLLLKGKGQKVSAGDVLLEVYSNSRYKLYDSKKLARQDNPVKIEGMLIKRIPTYSVSEDVGGK